MGRLLFPARLTDFGPLGLTYTLQLPRFHLVEGPRPGQLRQQVRCHGPREPGVYGMFDRYGNLIYIGKAKNLRARLLCYFRPPRHLRKERKILSQTRAIAWEISPDEFAALHRELELIRRFRPRCNVQGQPHRRRHTLICLGRKTAPYLFLAVRPPASTLAAFGPVRSGRHLEEAVRRLNHWFGLRDCPSSQELLFAEQEELFPRHRQAGCLRFELGTCLGPCTASCTRAAYAERVEQARRFLEGADLSALQQLEGDMARAAAAQQFERAASLRDKLAAIGWLHARLEQLRHIRQNHSFVYPLTGEQALRTWYLIHGGRAVAALPEPAHADSRRQAAATIAALFRPGAHPWSLEPYEHLDGLLLVAAWFRRYPQERQRLLTPDQALDLCQKDRA